VCTVNQSGQTKDGEMGETYILHGGDNKCVNILVGKAEGRRSL
jgi:hypothetical protein